MKDFKKIKLKELVEKPVEINVDEMKKIVGGVNLEDGCQTGICTHAINTIYCQGGAVCTSGIG
jgi:natural product precursor